MRERVMALIRTVLGLQPARVVARETDWVERKLRANERRIKAIDERIAAELRRGQRRRTGDA